MFDERPDAVVRRAIGGDPAAVAWTLERAATADDPVLVAMAALLAGDPSGLARAERLAVTTRDRQVAAIARAHLAGDAELVDALARDHLVSYPDSLIVSWIASGPERRDDGT
jgi:hypothetical protein